MKNKFPFPSGINPRRAPLRFLGLVMLSCASVGAQELLKNSDFESPFPVEDPTAGWAIVFPGGQGGDYADWGIAGQTLAASRVSSGHGAHLRPNNSGMVHAYFTQVVTNLSEGASYTVTIQKLRPGTGEYGLDKLQVHMAAVSGSSSNVVFGNGASDGPYSLPVVCDASRQIEVQLHCWKSAMAKDLANDVKSVKCSAWFDDCSLTLTP